MASAVVMPSPRNVWSAICFISGSILMWSVSVLGIVFFSFVSVCVSIVSHFIGNVYGGGADGE